VRDLGCDTGSRTFLLAERAPVIVSLSAIDVAAS
jgi:trans-aconitate methyltransferase